jgi:hypothetical protein
MDQARDGSAALDHCREVDRLAGVVQRWSLAAGLVSPMGVVMPRVVVQHPPQVPVGFGNPVSGADLRFLVLPYAALLYWLIMPSTTPWRLSRT